MADVAHPNGPTDNLRDFNYVQGGGFDENENYELYEGMDGAHGDSQSNDRAQWLNEFPDLWSEFNEIQLWKISCQISQWKSNYSDGATNQTTR